MSPNTPCPSTAVLRRSLDPDDPMPGPERQSIESHVDSCEKGCKAAIEALLRDNTLAEDPDATSPLDAATSPPSEPPAPFLAGYQILGELGRGGMGVVYKARQIQLNRLVALKMILAGGHAGADDLARFRREAEAVAALHHPHVVQIYEIGEQDGRPYFSLEFVEGGNLAQKLGGKPQPPAQAAELIETLARAVHCAHQQGIIHRDLKPANVLLTADDQPKIADFGLAKKLEGDAKQTRTDQIVGTPSYMAPEQATPGSAPVGTPADVYALGAMLYELLTGRPPFVAKTAWDVLTQVVSAEPTPPRQLQSRTPRDLETICLKCLRKEPSRRYGSAEALAEDLRRFLTNRPIEARRVGVVERTVKWVRRNAMASALSAAATVAAAAGVGGGWWAVQDRAARRATAEHKAEVALRRAQEDEEQAAAMERAADDKGAEEPETPETAKPVLELHRQAEAAVDEAEQALADVPGTEAARTRTAERRRQIAASRERAEKDAGLLESLDRARAARATARTGGLDALSVGRAYAAALSGYGLDVLRPEEETAAQIRAARPGVRLALILALDDWADDDRSRNAPEARSLGRIAAGADDDDWRRRYRAALGDMPALKRLAEEAPGLHLPAVSMIQLGRDLYMHGARAEATTLLREARRQYPTDFWVYVELNNSLFDPSHVNPATLDEAEACACAAAALRPDSASAFSNLGNTLLAHGDRAGAAQCYKKAMNLDPQFAPAVINFGNILYYQKDWAGAAGYYKQAIALDPKLAAGHVNLGDALFQQGDWAGAADCYKQAIGIDSLCAPAYSGLGDVLYKQGDTAGAAACRQKAGEIDPTYALSPVILGNTLYDQGDMTGAIAAYNRGLDIDPKDAYALCGLGNVLFKQNELDGAVACYRKAVDANPKCAPAHYDLGNALREQGDLDAAAACYRKAVELDPKLADAHFNLGDILIRLGDWAEAAACYERIIALDSQRPAVHYNLGWVLLQLGRFAEARASFRRCLDLLAPDAALRASVSDYLQICERLLALEAKLPSVLKGEQQPADDVERLGLATVCQAQGRCAAAARFRRDAFAHDHSLADDWKAADRYNGACCAARAGCGQGEDAKDLDEKARAAWRQQALDWLRADLDLRAKQLEDGKAGERRAVGEYFRRWQRDPALVGVRDPAELAKLPTDEQEAWRRLWIDAQSILDKAGEKR
ncbi:MAG TPA: tetratricopeptide repeat protein [Gemmataceae bacterium]|nr:tetratricopeptide repeat protein [Gemmataceae bacterium]